MFIVSNLSLSLSPSFSLRSAREPGLLQRQRRPASPVRTQRHLQQAHHPELYQLLSEAEVQGEANDNANSNPNLITLTHFYPL